MLVRQIHSHWLGSTVIVAATGPSLNESVAAQCIASGLHTIAVQDAYKLFPNAEILYGCDAAWWNEHEGVPGFSNERWSSHNIVKDDKLAAAKRWGLHLIQGERRPGFSFDHQRIHYGGNSGFQAINLAIHLGAKRILLVGFNMKNEKNKSNNDVIYHFFGRHRGPTLRNNDPTVFIPAFQEAARRLNGQVEIVNCTPRTALRCFPCMDLDKALLCR